jgi:hypothetical protein
MKIDENKLIQTIDFWHKSVKSPGLVSREAVEEIDYSGKEIIDVIGPRRSGKSSLLKLIISRLGLEGSFLYINFEDPFFIENNEASIIEKLIETYREYFNGNNLKYLFFDEIQEIESWEKAIRKLRDGSDYKIFITGSSSTLLSRELSSSITGRHTTFNMFPLSFKEFLFFKNIEVNSQKDIALKESLIKKRFDEYLETGGFPEAVVTGNKELLKNYFYDFLQRDVVLRRQVRDKDALEKMAVFLMSNSGKLISNASMQKAFNLAYESVDNYLEYLKEAFMFFELRQFSFSLKKQSKTLPKIYSVDTGLARAASFNFSKDNGKILENAVFLHLKRRSNSLFYYKTKNNLEVDFLVREKEKNHSLIQVCWDINDPETMEREIKALKEELNMRESVIVTHDNEDEIATEGMKITLVPAWKWFLEMND